MIAPAVVSCVPPLARASSRLKRIIFVVKMRSLDDSSDHVCCSATKYTSTSRCRTNKTVGKIVLWHSAERSPIIRLGFGQNPFGRSIGEAQRRLSRLLAPYLVMAIQEIVEHLRKKGA